MSCSRRRLPIALVLVLLAAAAGWAQQWSARGITEPYRDATLSATVPGRIAAILRKEGEAVRAGEVIVELDAELEALESDRRRLIADSKVELEAARRQLESLQLDLAAVRRLLETTRSVSEEEVRRRELEVRLAEADLQRLEIAEEREELEYRMARAQLRQRQVVAPFDGVVVKLFQEVGENATPQQPLVRLADTSRCRLVILMEAAATSTLKPQAAVRVRIDGVRQVLPGTVEFVSPVVDPSSALREVKVLFDNPEGRVYPGLTGTLLPP